MQKEFVKNPIIRPHSLKNEIFLARKKPVQMYYKRIEKLMNAGTSEILIHASGMAIPNALSLFLQISSLFKSHEIQTSSTLVIDEVNSVPKFRKIPSIHIRLK